MCYVLVFGLFVILLVWLFVVDWCVRLTLALWGLFSRWLLVCLVDGLYFDWNVGRVFCFVICACLGLVGVGL